MTNVVSLHNREPLVWVCRCGCSTFKLYEGGVSECANCNKQSADGGEWVNELPEPEGPVRDVLPDTKIISLTDASPAAALRGMLNRVDADALTALIAIESNGRVRTWGGVDTEDRREWLDERLEDARGLLTMLVQSDAPA